MIGAYNSEWKYKKICDEIEVGATLKKNTFVEIIQPNLKTYKIFSNQDSLVLA